MSRVKVSIARSAVGERFESEGIVVSTIPKFKLHGRMQYSS